MIGRTVSHYEILEEIDEGGMGRIYKARDTRLNVLRALKFVHPHLADNREFKARFLREARTAAALEHYHICAIHEVNETPEGVPFLCMTYYEGESLASRLQRGPVPFPELTNITCGVARGLLCAHRQGVIHRDIKPGNIMITRDGVAKILDFGLVKLVDRTRITRNISPLGTPRYMSPEQIRGDEVDHRTDIWSLGVILYEMACGTTPFAGDDDPAVFHTILHEDPLPLDERDPALPAPLVRVVDRCLRKDPEERYADVSEFLEELAPCRGRRRKRSKIGRIAFAMAAVLLLIGAGWWWTTRPEPLYSTATRLAVLPVENLAHPALDDLASGLTVTTARMLEDMTSGDRSTWVVPDRIVAYADLRGFVAARDAFGVNRLLTGSVQRHAAGHLLQLVLRDADSTERLNSAAIVFDAEAPGSLADSLAIVLDQLLDLDEPATVAASAGLPGNPAAARRFLDGLGALRAGEPDRAIGLLRSAAVREPGFAGCLVALGCACRDEFLDSGRSAPRDSALHVLGQAAEAAPDDWRPHYERGETLRLASETDAAVQEFETAARLRPANPQVCDRLARVYRELERPTEAESLLRTAFARRPDYFETHRLLGRHFLRIEDYATATDHFEDALSLAPDDALTHQWLAVVLWHQNDLDGAVVHFERTYLLQPNFENCSNIGLILYLAKRFDESARYYELSMEIGGENDYETWGNLAIALYWSDGRRAESVARFRRAIELVEMALAESPDDPTLVGHLIEYNAMGGNESAARTLIDRYAESAAGNAQLLYRIGCALEIMGDRTGALRYLSEAVRNGHPLVDIQGTRELADLVADPMFRQLTEKKAPRTSSSG